ncbi:MAG: TerB family tellurite resistance protein [Aestuariivita sp.]|nr:TerB family tellurite resistance protein [Aestuariivita sp.]
MFAKLIRRLTETAPTELPQDDARLALAALLVRIARSDGQYESIEVEKIQKILAERYSLNGNQSNELLRDAEILEAQAPDTVRFTRSIKNAVPYQDRLAVIEAFWEVVLVDGARDAAEDSLLRLMTKLLGITDVDSARARQRVMAK